ncbi:MAG: uracil phosphoribosyltransferase [Verrucomicrobiales bacterium]
MASPLPTWDSLNVCAHPLLQAGLTRLRDRDTTCDAFRRHVREMSMLLFVEASRDLPTQEVSVSTPLAVTTGRALVHPLVLVPILRAGLGMVDGIWPLVPTAELAHIGIYRDEETALPHPYYSRFCPALHTADVFLLDPMLATGQSAVEAVNQLKAHGATRLKFVCLLSAPPGLETFHRAHGDVPIFTAAVDERLNEQSYIVPGLGDAGDRYFGTISPS